jgi:hypothetical protein
MQKMAVLIETNVDYLIFSSSFSYQDFNGWKHIKLAAILSYVRESQFFLIKLFYF